jgi:hypothetical protein
MENTTLEPETLYFALLTSSRMLAEAAQTVEGSCFVAEKPEEITTVAAILDSCRQSVETLLAALPPMETEAAEFGGETLVDDTKEDWPEAA